MPRRGNVADLARGALLVAKDGERAGITDPEVLREARFAYRQLWREVPSGERARLPEPETLPVHAR
jgi:hypothetical protein